MKIALTYSSKQGLIQNYQKLFPGSVRLPAEDFFAEGDSMDTILAVMEALRIQGYDVTGIEADDNASVKLVKERPDLVMNVAEGLFGDFRESYIPMICERLQIPYTGSDPLTLGICLNKARTKEILGYYQIPTPAFQVFYPHESVDTGRLIFPTIVKPVAEGSSKGIDNRSVVQNPIEAKELIIEKLLKYNQPVLAESFINGNEFTVALWGNGDEISMLPIVGISFDTLPDGAWPMYSYEAKWIWDTPEKPLQIFKCPAEMDIDTARQIEALTKNVYRILGVRDWCRIDVRLDSKGVPNIIELNPLPGILPNPEDNSCFPKAARTAGYSYSEMIEHLISIACRRIGIKEGSHAAAYRL